MSERDERDMTEAKDSESEWVTASGTRYRTRKLAWIAIAAGLLGCGVAVTLRGGAVEWFMLGVLGGIAALSGAIPLVVAASLTVERSLRRTEMTAGEANASTLTVGRKWSFPVVWIAVQDEYVNRSDIAYRAGGYSAVETPLFRKQWGVTYKMNALRRGIYDFQPVTVTVGDWLGLTAIRRTFRLEQKLTALPAELPSACSGGMERWEEVVPVKQINAASGYAGGGGDDISGIPVARREAGGGPDSRPYREGDALWSVDYRAAARGRGLYTKLRMEEACGTVAIVIDQRRCAYDDNAALFDACISWAVKGAADVLGRGSEAVVATADWTCRLKPDSAYGENGGMAGLLRMLAQLRGDREGEIEDVLHVEGSGLPAGSLLHIFTGDWQAASEWIELARMWGERECRLQLHVAIGERKPTGAMREAERLLRDARIGVDWLAIHAAGKDFTRESEEGGITRAMG